MDFHRVCIMEKIEQTFQDYQTLVLIDNDSKSHKTSLWSWSTSQNRDLWKSGDQLSFNLDHVSLWIHEHIL